MSAALSRYLKDFSTIAVPPPAVADPIFEDVSVLAEVADAEPIDIEALRQTAFDEGRAAAEADLSVARQEALDAAVAAHRDELEALRVRYETEAAERIGAGLRQIAALLAETIGAETAAVLGPVMSEAMSTKAIAELACLIEAAILEGAPGQINVSGPRDLFESLTARLGEKAGLLSHTDATDIDLSVTIGESVLVTRMSAWADGLRKILA